ncbi:MAG: NUDIX domain-containing protein [Candidatus Omnitrophica bacterium]|nr:NUDIX domain-containing protein [Candidatus Omnitrophota bacterium]
MIKWFHNRKQTNPCLNNNQYIFNLFNIQSAHAEVPVTQSSAILWDPIVSIKFAGREQVYDIEVDGTHNFIGNGIFAHNTYMNALPKALATAASARSLGGEDVIRQQRKLAARALAKSPSGVSVTVTCQKGRPREESLIWVEMPEGMFIIDIGGVREVLPSGELRRLLPSRARGEQSREWSSMLDLWEADTSEFPDRPQDAPEEKLLSALFSHPGVVNAVHQLENIYTKPRDDQNPWSGVWLAYRGYQETFAAGAGEMIPEEWGKLRSVEDVEIARNMLQVFTVLIAMLESRPDIPHVNISTPLAWRQVRSPYLDASMERLRRAAQISAALLQEIAGAKHAESQIYNSEILARMHQILSARVAAFKPEAPPQKEMLAKEGAPPDLFDLPEELRRLMHPAGVDIARDSSSDAAEEPKAKEPSPPLKKVLSAPKKMDLRPAANLGADQSSASPVGWLRDREVMRRMIPVIQAQIHEYREGLVKREAFDLAEFDFWLEQKGLEQSRNAMTASNLYHDAWNLFKLAIPEASILEVLQRIIHYFQEKVEQRFVPFNSGEVSRMWEALQHYYNLLDQPGVPWFPTDDVREYFRGRYEVSLPSEWEIFKQFDSWVRAEARLRERDGLLQRTSIAKYAQDLRNMVQEWCAGAMQQSSDGTFETFYPRSSGIKTIRLLSRSPLPSRRDHLFQAGWEPAGKLDAQGREIFERSPLQLSVKEDRGKFAQAYLTLELAGRQQLFHDVYQDLPEAEWEKWSAGNQNLMARGKFGSWRFYPNGAVSLRFTDLEHETDLPGEFKQMLLRLQNEGQYQIRAFGDLEEPMRYIVAERSSVKSGEVICCNAQGEVLFRYQQEFFKRLAPSKEEGVITHIYTDAPPALTDDFSWMENLGLPGRVAEAPGDTSQGFLPRAFIPLLAQGRGTWLLNEADIPAMDVITREVIVGPDKAPVPFREDVKNWRKSLSGGKGKGSSGEVEVNLSLSAFSPRLILELTVEALMRGLLRKIPGPVMGKYEYTDRLHQEDNSFEDMQELLRNLPEPVRLSQISSIEYLRQQQEYQDGMEDIRQFFDSLRSQIKAEIPMPLLEGHSDKLARALAEILILGPDGKSAHQTLGIHQAIAGIQANRYVLELRQGRMFLMDLAAPKLDVKPGPAGHVFDREALHRVGILRARPGQRGSTVYAHSPFELFINESGGEDSKVNLTVTPTGSAGPRLFADPYGDLTNSSVWTVVNSKLITNGKFGMWKFYPSGAASIFYSRLQQETRLPEKFRNMLLRMQEEGLYMIRAFGDFDNPLQYVLAERDNEDRQEVICLTGEGEVLFRYKWTTGKASPMPAPEFGPEWIAAVLESRIPKHHEWPLTEEDLLGVDQVDAIPVYSPSSKPFIPLLNDLEAWIARYGEGAKRLLIENDMVLEDRMPQQEFLPLPKEITEAAIQEGFVRKQTDRYVYTEKFQETDNYFGDLMWLLENLSQTVRISSAVSAISYFRFLAELAKTMEDTHQSLWSDEAAIPMPELGRAIDQLQAALAEISVASPDGKPSSHSVNLNAAIGGIHEGHYALEITQGRMRLVEISEARSLGEEEGPPGELKVYPVRVEPSRTRPGEWVTVFDTVSDADFLIVEMKKYLSKGWLSYLFGVFTFFIFERRQVNQWQRRDSELSPNDRMKVRTFIQNSYDSQAVIAQNSWADKIKHFPQLSRAEYLSNRFNLFTQYYQRVFQQIKHEVKPAQSSKVVSARARSLGDETREQEISEKAAQLEKFLGQLKTGPMMRDYFLADPRSNAHGSFFMMSNENDWPKLVKELPRMSPQSDGIRVHMGVSGFQNEEIMAIRHSDIAIMIGINSAEIAAHQTLKEVLCSPALSGADRLSPEDRFQTINDEWHRLTQEKLSLQPSSWEPANWIQDPQKFSYIQKMFLENRVFSLQMDFRDEKSFAVLSEWFKENGLTLDTLYISNAYEYKDTGLKNRSGDLFERSIASVIHFDSQRGTLIIDSRWERHHEPFGPHLHVKVDLAISHPIFNVKQVVHEALEILSVKDAARYNDELFKQRLLENPFLLDGYRLFDLVRDDAIAKIVTEPAEVLAAELIEAYYPDGKKTEFISVYPDEVGDWKNQEPQPIGAGSYLHTHPDKNPAVDQLMETLRRERLDQQGNPRLPFVHAAVTSFIILNINGKHFALSTVRATTKGKFGGLLESVSGGHVKAGESLQTAAARELVEELGFTIKNVPLVGYQRYEDKSSDNTHDFVAMILLDEAQTRAFLKDFEEKNIRLFTVDTQEDLARHMPNRVSKVEEKTPEIYTQELRDKKGEIAYGVLSPFEVLIAYYRDLKQREGLAGVAKEFAWIELEKEKEGNFLGKDSLINSALDTYKTLTESSDQARSLGFPDSRISSIEIETSRIFADYILPLALRISPEAFNEIMNVWFPEMYQAAAAGMPARQVARIQSSSEVTESIFWAA